MGDIVTGGRSGPRRIELGEIDSTNAHAMRLAQTGERGPVWISAASQTSGRGRSGRVWASVEGNLYASLLTTLDCQPRVVHQIALVTGVAVFDAISAAASRPLAGLRLKWPNDVLIGPAKVAGILAESTAPPSGIGQTVVIGVGINLAGHPDGLGRAATSLAGHGVVASPAAMLDHLTHTIDQWLADWQLGSRFDRIRDAWIARAGAEGEAMSINTPGGPVAGTFAGLDPAGALLLRTPDAAVRAFNYGDVTLAPAKEREQ